LVHHPSIQLSVIGITIVIVSSKVKQSLECLTILKIIS